MGRKLIMVVVVMTGAMFLFAPLAAAGDDQEPEKAKKADQKAKKKAKEKAKKKKAKRTTRADANSSAMAVNDAKTTTEVKDREAVDTSTSFNKGDKVTVWLSVKNPTEPNKVKLVFFRNDAKAGTIELDVGKSYRWRTWARRTVGSAGDWKVDVRDDDGNSLKTLEFTVK